MSNEELPAPPNKPTKSRWQDWIWTTILSVIIAKLFGIVGGLVIFGSYYWLKPKYGAWLALAASGAAGVIIAFGFGFMLEKHVVTPAQGTPREEHSTSTKAAPALQEQQIALLTAAREIVAQYPQLDANSPQASQSAIDYVVGKRDGYVANGHAIDIALRMAANDYGEQLAVSQQREAEQRYAQQITSQRFNQPSVSQAQAVTNDYIRRKNEPCQVNAVMTDEEIARCRAR